MVAKYIGYCADQNSQNSTEYGLTYSVEDFRRRERPSYLLLMDELSRKDYSDQQSEGGGEEVANMLARGEGGGKG